LVCHSVLRVSISLCKALLEDNKVIVMEFLFFVTVVLCHIKAHFNHTRKRTLW